MYAYAVTNVGIVINVTILSSSCDTNADGASLNALGIGDAYNGAARVSEDPYEHVVTAISAGERPAPVTYSCRAVGPPVPQKVFADVDVLPFGILPPSAIFGVVGRHTNKGLVVGITPDGLYIVRPYPPRRPTVAARAREPETGPLFLQSTPPAPPAALSFTTVSAASPPASPPASASASQDPTAAMTAPATAPVPAAPTTVVSGGTNKSAAPDNWTSERPLLPECLESHCTAASSAASLQATYALLTSGPELVRLFQVRAEHESAGEERRMRARIRQSARDMELVEEAEAETAREDWRQIHALMEGTRLWELHELTLPPPLALHAPVAPLRVGSLVVARRYGCADALHTATVIAAHYDVSYDLRYEVDGGIDRGVLHSDIHLLREPAAGGGPGACRVRDRVLVALQHQVPAVVVEALPDDRHYRAVLTATRRDVITVGRRGIVYVFPIDPATLYADPRIVAWFRELEVARSGRVMWKDVRRLIMNWDMYGKSLTMERVGEMQRDLRVRIGRIEPQFLRKVPVQEEEMLLDFKEFEYIVLQARNLL